MDDVARDQFVQLADAWQQTLEACMAAWKAICRAVADVLTVIAHSYRDLCRAHILPRQYRDTMMRRKIRRAAERGYIRLTL